MNITVVGTGYVGLVTGACLAYAGNQVTCVDIDEAKVARMRAGRIPIYEPGLEEVFQEVLAKKRLTVTTQLPEGFETAEIVFMALPTPSGADGSADLSAVLSVADQIGPLLQRYTVIVNKSTVPVGTGERLREKIAAKTGQAFDVVSNPEFLREGFAVQDFMHPDRVVIGVETDKAADIMRELYEPFLDTPEQFVQMDIRSAEITKYAANSFLAMKVSFMNEIANLCERLGANVDAVRLGIGPDERIGRRFLFAGIGYGGSCFPKDVNALQFTANEAGTPLKLLDSIVDVNQLQKQRLLDKLFDYYKGELMGKHFALWGLAFKPDTDDIREAPSLFLIDKLLAAGVTISAYDPEATANAQAHFGDRQGLEFAVSAMEALTDADALLIVTEWEEFRAPDFAAMAKALKQPVIFDGRNLYSLEHMRQANFYYNSIGRPVVEA